MWRSRAFQPIDLELISSLSLSVFLSRLLLRVTLWLSNILLNRRETQREDAGEAQREDQPERLG